MIQSRGGTVLQEDILRMADNGAVAWERLAGKTVLVTGSTGLIGSLFVRCLCRRNSLYHAGLRVIAVTRNEEKARRLFADEGTGVGLSFLERDVCDGFDPGCHVDYIIHAAATTSSRTMVQQPVETMMTSVQGTVHALELARKNNAGVLYLSSMEVYGQQPRGKKLAEGETGTFAPSHLRNGYPLGKLQAEALCHAYAAEYGVQANVLRLAQTLGAGVAESDRRVFAEFARCAAAGRDIVLKTAGESERCYLYTTDAVSAMLTVLLSDGAGGVYNAANEDSYASIRQMVEKIAAVGGVRCRVETDTESDRIYPAPSYWRLDTTALRQLGWRAEVGADEMVRRLLESVKETTV